MLKLYFTTLVFSIAVYISNAQITYTQNVFGFIGDYGVNNSVEDSVSQLIKSWNPEAIIALGDHNYPTGSASDIDNNIGKYFHDYIKPYSGSYGAEADSSRFWPCLGNHDIMSNNGSPYFDYFQLPSNERYYDFVNDDIHFFCLHSNPSEIDGTTDSSTQGLWLKEQLQNSAAKWKIVFAHHSPYCSDLFYGNHSYMQWPFKDWGADIVIAGHAHVYERLMVDSFPYIVNGLGGNVIYPFDEIIKPGSVTRYNEKHGALQLIAQPDTLSFRFFNTDSELIDSLFLTKRYSLGINNKNEPLSLKIYPNPTLGNLSIDIANFKVQNSEITISISDMTGNKLYIETFITKQSSLFKNLTLPDKIPAGLYFMQISCGKQQLNDKVSLIK